MNQLTRISALLTLAAMLTACAGASNQQTGTGVGAATGAGLGALVGQAIGRDTKSTVLGASIGAVAGGLAGNLIGAYMDKQEEQLRQVQEASIQREQDVLTATFKSDFLFALNSADLKPEAEGDLNRVATVLNDYPQTTIRIEGHTDASGSAEYNQALSERRAVTVKNALARRGVEASRMEAVGYGKSQLISSNDAANRRVVIVINPVRQS